MVSSWRSGRLWLGALLTCLSSKWGKEERLWNECSVFGAVCMCCPGLPSPLSVMRGLWLRSDGNMHRNEAESGYTSQSAAQHASLAVTIYERSHCSSPFHCLSGMLELVNMEKMDSGNCKPLYMLLSIKHWILKGTLHFFGEIGSFYNSPIVKQKMKDCITVLWKKNCKLQNPLWQEPPKRKIHFQKWNSGSE